MTVKKILAIGAVVLAVVFGSILPLYAAEDPAPTASEQDSFHENVLPFFEDHCFRCHSGDDPSAGVALDVFESSSDLIRQPERLDAVFRVVREGEMPPSYMPRPSAEEIVTATRGLDELIAAVEALMPPRPGRVTLRRLNRVEYENTIHDLLGVEFQATEDFPSDDVGYGFDNIGDVLSLPPLLMEKYLAAAELIASKAVALTPEEATDVRLFDASQLSGGSAYGDRRVLASSGKISCRVDLDSGGEYELRITAYGDQAGDESAKMELKIDGKAINVFDVEAVQNAPEDYRRRLDLTPGSHDISAAFINDFYNPEADNPTQRDRNLGVVKFELAGPIPSSLEDYPASHRRIFIAVPSDTLSKEDAARLVLEQLAAGTYRRPVTPDELDRLILIANLAWDEGDSFEAGVELALTAMLCSPHFLFMVPSDPAEATDDRYLNDFELAERLSYFLWSSMPDEELFDLATQGALRGDLPNQVVRMLADPKSERFVQGFALQWLQLRNLELASPDGNQFPDFDEHLRRSMRLETEHFFSAVLHEDHSVLKLIDADFTYVNETLADLYGISGVSGDEFQRVSLEGTVRGGVLTHAGVLTVTSNPTRTSPVKRGKWVMENILGTPPPDPPANVPLLEEQSQ